MELLPLLCLCLLTWFGSTFADGNAVIKIHVKEGNEVILPCSLSSNEDIVNKLFDWKKEGQKEVFLYDEGRHYNNGLSGQDEQFKGRVSHFQEQLKFGNASIIIRNTKVTDSGNYTCDFPRLQPKQKFYIKLIVGAAPKPSFTVVQQTQHWALLQCEVDGASPKPKIIWKDNSGKILPAETPQVIEKAGRYDVTLRVNVTKTDYYHCVVTQDEINHQIQTRTHMFIAGGQNAGSSSTVVVPLVIVGLCLALLATVG